MRVERLRCSWILSGLLTAVVACVACRSAAAERELPAEQVEEERFQEELEKVRTWVLPLQKRWAREFIKKNPGSPRARVAQELLDDYELYGTAAQMLGKRELHRSHFVAEYWISRSLPSRAVDAYSTQITNLADVPVLYQIKGPAMDWLGPYRLRVGQTHRLKYAAVYRRITPDGRRVYSLPLGARYAFRRPAGGGPPRLVRWP